MYQSETLYEYKEGERKRYFCAYDALFPKQFFVTKVISTNIESDLYNKKQLIEISYSDNTHETYEVYSYYVNYETNKISFINSIFTHIPNIIGYSKIMDFIDKCKKVLSYFK